MRIIEDKRALRRIAKNTRIKRKIKWQRKGTKDMVQEQEQRTEFSSRSLLRFLSLEKERTYALNIRKLHFKDLNLIRRSLRWAIDYL